MQCYLIAILFQRKGEIHVWVAPAFYGFGNRAYNQVGTVTVAFIILNNYSRPTPKLLAVCSFERHHVDVTNHILFLTQMVSFLKKG